MKPPTIKQCRFYWWILAVPPVRGYPQWAECCQNPFSKLYFQDLRTEGQRAGDWCTAWRSGGLLPEVYVDANAQEVDDAEYVPEWWQTGEAGVVTAQLVRRGKRRRIRRVRMAVRYVDAS